MLLTKKAILLTAIGTQSTVIQADPARTNIILAAEKSAQLFGSAQRDVMTGGKGDDTLYGMDGNDTLSGGLGNDRLDGGRGNDWLEGGGGNDVLTGGEGNDTFVFQINNSNASINFASQIGGDVVKDFVSGEDSIDLSSIFARFRDGDVDAIVQALAEASAPARRGADFSGVDNPVAIHGEVFGLNGEHYDFQVEARTDLARNKSVELWIKNADDASDSGALIRFEGIGNLKATDFLRETVKIAHGTQQADQLDYSAVSGTKGVKVYGFAGDDRLTGTANDDYFFGDAGADTIRGGAGSDNLYGSGSGDALFGDDGDDFLYGGVNGGYISGKGVGVGTDTLTGGAGRDVFVFGGKVVIDSLGNPNFVFDQGATVITDFKAGEDRIKIANTAGFSGNLKWASLDYDFDAREIASHLTVGTADRNDLVFTDGATRYLIDNFFLINKGLTLDSVKAHVDLYFTFL